MKEHTERRESERVDGKRETEISTETDKNRERRENRVKETPPLFVFLQRKLAPDRREVFPNLSQDIS